MENLKVGCSSRIIDVPLFVELCGYGNFKGRRNRGIHDPLYCRVASFRQRSKRVIVITNDLVVIDREDSWKIRAEITRRLKISGASIMICGSHTHSGPATKSIVGIGEVNQGFKEKWMELAVNLALEAAENETPVTLSAGRSVMTKKLGVNRVSQHGPIDPEIRWVKFIDGKGEVKLIVHNHGMHAVAFDSGFLVSADWPGAVNSLIIDSKVAENVLFFQGTCGDVNPKNMHTAERGELELKRIAENYVSDLEKGFKKGLKNVEGFPVKVAMEEVMLPTEEVTPGSLRKTAELLFKKNRRKKKYSPYLTDRLEEMALWLEAGNSLDVVTEFQVIRLGDVYIYAVPGEMFTSLGMEIIGRSPGRMAIVSTNSNDHCHYLPSPDAFEKNPDIMKKADSLYGFYAVHMTAPCFLKAPYKSSVGPFLVDKFIDMAESLKDDTGFTAKTGRKKS